MAKLKNKKIILVALALLIFIGIIIFINKTKTLECSKKVNNKIYKEDINISIKYNKKIKEYYIKEDYSYNEGYMDNLVDAFDNKEIYLNNISKIDGVLTNINQDGYQYSYNISITLDKVNKKDYTLLDIDDVMKLDKLNSIKKYYEELGYSCK